MAVSDIIKKKLESAFNTSNVEVIDESHQHAGHAGAPKGGESHFAVTVVSGQFTGLSRVACHKLIYAALDEELKTGVHALRINAIALKT